MRGLSSDVETHDVYPFNIEEVRDAVNEEEKFAAKEMDRQSCVTIKNSKVFWVCPLLLESAMSLDIASQFPLQAAAFSAVSNVEVQHNEAENALAHAAQEVLGEAVLFEDAIARTDIEPPFPQDLPPIETLKQRNEETLLLGACHQLEKALGQSGQMAGQAAGTQVDGALKQLEKLAADNPQDVTDDMRALMEQARNTHVAGMQASSAQRVEKEEFQSTNNAKAAEVSGDGALVLEDGEIHADLAGDTTQEVLVSDELLKELESFRPGEAVLSDDAKLEDMKAALARMERMRDALPGTSVASLPVRVALDEKIFQAGRAVSSRMKLEEGLNVLADTAALPLEERASRLNTTLRGMMLQMREQAAASALVNSPELSEALNAADILEQRGYVRSCDVRALEEALCQTLEASLAEFALHNDAFAGLSPEDLSGTGKLCLEAGLEVTEMGRALADCLRDIPGGESARSAFLEIVLKGMAEGPDATRLQFVDMLFQGAYPERADTALLLKQAVASPENRDGVVYQHELVQSLHVIQRDILDAVRIPGARGQGNGRTGVIERAAGGVSARSFLLTPDLVKALGDRGKVDIPDLNYHIAHVALLQAAAGSYGLLNGANDVRADHDPLQIDDFRAWCATLGLDSETIDYASDIAARLEDPDTEAGAAARLIEAGERFNKGLKGAATLDRAGKLVANTASMATHRSSERHIHAMYQTNPEFLAREVLDKHIVNLTGLIDVNERLDLNEAGLELDYDKIDAAMLEQAQKLKGNSADGVDGEEIQRTLQDALNERAATLHGLRGKRGRFITSAKTLSDFAKAVKECLELRAKNAERRDARQEAKAEKALLKFAWPHQRRERDAVCRDVVRLAEILHKLDGDNTDLTVLNATGHTLVEERDNLLARLADVDSRTMRHTAKAVGGGLPAPEAFIEKVLPTLLPRAKAVLYFADGDAKEDQKAIRDDLYAFEQQQQKVFSLAGKAERVFGADIIRRLETTVVAAMLKSFLDGGADAAMFNVRNPATFDAIKGQLKDWGLDADQGIMKGLVPMVLGNMTTAKGSINMARLRQESKKVGLSLAGKTALGEKAKELRDDGKSRLAARREASRITSGGEVLHEAFRKEGVRGLMAGVARPGQGFVYDRTRGVVLDSGTVFSVTDSKLVAKANLSSPLTAKLEVLHGNSLAVVNLGNGAYQVLLKGRTAVNVAVGLGISLPHGFSAKAGAGVGGDHSQGVALRFSGMEDCRAFLDAFMDSESGLADKARNRSLWLRAAQIRFINGSEISGNASLALTHTLFAQKLSASQSATISGTASLAFSGKVNQTLEENTHGETAVFERAGTARVGLAVTTGVMNAEKHTMSNINPLARSAGFSFDMLQRFKVSTGSKGLMPDTCMELECARGDEHVLHRLDSLLPEEVRTRISSEPALLDSVQRALKKAPPTARVVAHYDLKPGLLEELRSRFVEARHAGVDKQEEILKAIHDRLASRESYEPTRLSVRLNRPAPISKSYSPGVGGIKLVRANTMLNTDCINIDLRRPAA